LRIANEGEAGEPGAPMGDLYIFIHVKPNEIFQRDNADLYVEIPITFAQATLGATIEVPTVTGRAELKIPPGTQPGTLLRMKNKGLPYLRNYGHGDQYVKITIDVPKRLSKKQKDLLKSFDNELKGKKPHEKIFESIKDIFK
jgi:molecular chaperone DnaJ